MAKAEAGGGGGRWMLQMPLRDGLAQDAARGKGRWELERSGDVRAFTCAGAIVCRTDEL